MYRFYYLLSLALAAGCGPEPSPLAARSRTPKQQTQANTNDFRPKGRVGTHGMLVFGSEGKIYASHIPMLMAMHNVHVVFEVALFDEHGAPYAADFTHTLHSIRPQRMSLDDVILGDKPSFAASLYQGNFEATDAVHLGAVSVQVLAQPVTARVLVEREALIYDRLGQHLVARTTATMQADQLLLLAPDAPACATIERPFDSAAALNEQLLQAGQEASCNNEAGETVALPIWQQLSLLVGPDFVP